MAYERSPLYCTPLKCFGDIYPPSGPNLAIEPLIAKDLLKHFMNWVSVRAEVTTARERQEILDSYKQRKGVNKPISTF